MKIRPEARHALLPLLLLSLLLSCGCGKGSTRPKADSNIVEACELIASTELEAIIGGKVGEPESKRMGKPGGDFWTSNCNWYAEEKSISLSILIGPHRNAEGGTSALATYEATMKASLGDGFSLTAVPGIGEAAGWAEGVKQLTVFQGSYRLIITVSSPDLDGPGALSVATAIATSSLSNLD